MSAKLYVGNLPYTTGDAELKTHFEQVGEVVSVKIIQDRETNRSKGYGFVEMASDDLAQDAIASADVQELDGRELKINEARPQEKRPNNRY